MSLTQLAIPSPAIGGSGSIRVARERPEDYERVERVVRPLGQATAREGRLYGALKEATRYARAWCNLCGIIGNMMPMKKGTGGYFLSRLVEAGSPVAGINSTLLCLRTVQFADPCATLFRTFVGFARRIGEEQDKANKKWGVKRSSVEYVCGEGMHSSVHLRHAIDQTHEGKARVVIYLGPMPVDPRTWFPEYLCTKNGTMPLVAESRPVIKPAVREEGREATMALLSLLQPENKWILDALMKLLVDGYEF